MAYGMAWRPDGSASPTVVYSSFLNAGQPEAPDEHVVRYLQDGGVRLLIVGHQPHGDAPAVMRCTGGAEEDLLILTADTSFSNDVVWESEQRDGMAGSIACGDSRAGSAPGLPAPSPRGECVIEVCVHCDTPRTEAATGVRGVRVHGVLSDGRKVDCDVGGDAVVGSQTADGWWVKARMSDGKLLLSRGEGFNVTNREATAVETGRARGGA